MQNPISWIVGIVLTLVLVVSFVGDGFKPYQDQQKGLTTINISLMDKIQDAIDPQP